tara:strand:+ start:114 stop:623 length:510 start_codon:yes stop_codon:yes gene_type:complete
MEKSHLSYSIWGNFDNKTKISLENIKGEVNDNLKSIKFPIHLTISSHFKGKETEIIKKLILISKIIKKFTIETDNYDFKKNFFQSLYIKVRLSKQLKFNKKLIDNLLKAKKILYRPHISLYYGKLSNQKKKKIISNLKQFKKKIKIVEICFVKNNEKKFKWKIIKRFKL